MTLWLLTVLAVASPRPNILFVLTDDQSHRTVSAYEDAYPWARTPNMDALARNGVRFRNTYLSPWCMPSRLSLLTGRQPHAVEIRMEGKYPRAVYDPKQTRFWPKLFRDAGYVTAQIGKWHTGIDTGAGRDWDYQVVWNRPGLPDNSGSYYSDQLISIDGAAPKKVPGYSTDNYTKWATEFIRGQDRAAGKPWYLWLCYGGSHGPYTPAQRHLSAYPGVKTEVPSDIYPPRPGKPSYMQTTAAWVRGADGQPHSGGPKGKTLAEGVRQYNQVVMSLDEGIGQLIKTLEETGQRDNTLVVYTADQGFAWGQHGFKHKLAPYDANMRAPFIVSMPGTLPKGKVVEAPVNASVDLVPTFFAFAGVNLPPWPVHGHDLTPLLKDSTQAWNHPVLMTYTARAFGSDTAQVPTAKAKKDLMPGGVPWWVSLRSGRFKYIRTLVAGEPEELYDLGADPQELTNLASDPKHAAKLKDLRATTITELGRTEARMVDNLPVTN